MDLGEVGLLLVTRGEDEARRAIEDYVRAADAATNSLEENAQKAIRAEEAHERSIQRQIKAQTELVQTAASLRKSYEDTSASFSKMEKATLDYYRTEEMLKKGMDAGVVSATEYARVMELVQQKLVEVAGAIRVEDEEARIALQERSNAELAKAGSAYDAVIASIDKAYAANMRYSESLRKINDAYELEIITDKQRREAIKLVTNEYNREIESPRVKQMERERDESNKLKQAHAQLAAEYARLNASVNPAVRAQQIYDTAIKTLDRSLEKGIITQHQYNTTLADVQVKMERAGHTVNQFGQVMTTSERGFSKFARGGFQQLGYQVGDFAVQVQGGTNVLVAFGQQGAQLAGIFGATGAVIGAGIAIVSALANAYLTANGVAKSLDDTINDMNSSFQTLNDTLGELNTNEYGEIFGSLSKEIKSMTESALTLDEAMAMKNMVDTFAKLKKEYVEPGFFQTLGSYLSAGLAVGGGAGIVPSPKSQVDANQRQQQIMGETSLENYKKLGFDMGYETFRGYQDAIDKASKAGNMEEVTRQLSAMFVDAVPDIQTAQDVIKSGGYDMLEAYRKLTMMIAEANSRMKEHREGKPIETEMLVAKERGHMEAISQATDGAAKASYRRYQEESKVVDVLDKVSIKMSAERGHQEAIASSTDHASKMAYKRYQDESKTVDVIDKISRKMAEERGHQQAIDEARLYASGELQRMETRRLAEERVKQQALVDILMEAYNVGKDITLLDLSLGIDGAALVAERLATQLGISLASAQAIVGLGKGKGDQTIYDPRQPGYDPYKAEVGRTKAMMSGAAYYIPPKSKTTNKTASDPLEELRAQIKLEREMIGLTDEQQRVYQALGQDRSNYSQVEINAITAEIKALEDKTSAIENMQSISDTIQSSMSDAFMSMVDGTATVEDAFKSMAISIIEQLYEVMVVQKIVGQWSATSQTGTGLVGSLMGFFNTSQANGGAWMGGNQITAYAKGGVVDSPTMFSMSGGRRGLMGEAGPEAILPLQRTSSGKLGVAVAGAKSNAVSEQTHIHNNFNITGSDVATVKREIYKAVPLIVEASTRNTANARRRGGKMAADLG